MMHNKLLIEKDDPAFTLYDPAIHKNLKDFVIQEYPYDVEFLNDKVDAIYGKRDRPRAVFFTPLENRTSITRAYALQLKPLGKKFKDKLNFYIQDAEKVTRKYKLKGDANYIIFDTDMEKSKYRFIDKVFNGSIDVPALIEFTQKFLEKKAPKYIRSADVNPDDLQEPVYPVVAKTYNEIVFDKTKHVFLRFYDKMMQRYPEQFQMRKEWWKVGRNFMNNTKDILIAEIEVNDNDILDYFNKEMNLNHYYFLFTKTQKEKPFVYKDNVNATDLIKFAEKIITQEDENAKIKKDL